MYNEYDNTSQQVLQRYIANGKGKSNVYSFKRSIRESGRLFNEGLYAW